MEIITGIITAVISLILGGFIGWQIQKHFHKKSERSVKDSAMYIQNGFEEKIEALEDNLRAAGVIRDKDFDISDLIAEQIQEVEKATSKVVEPYIGIETGIEALEETTTKVFTDWEQSKIYFPELLLFRRTLNGCARKVEIAYLRLLSNHHQNSAGGKFLTDFAFEARKRLKELGEQPPPVPSWAQQQVHSQES